MGVAGTIYKPMKMVVVNWELHPSCNVSIYGTHVGLLEVVRNDQTWVFLGKRMPYGSATTHPHLTGFCEPYSSAPQQEPEQREDEWVPRALH